MKRKDLNINFMTWSRDYLHFHISTFYKFGNDFTVPIKHCLSRR